MMFPSVIAAPRLRQIPALLLFGGGLLVAGLGTGHHSYRLDLYAASMPCAIYASAWNEGAVVLDHDGSNGREVVFHRNFLSQEGCNWRATEVLTPIGASRWKYQYDEEMLSCPDGIEPSSYATPRSGIVTASLLPGRAPQTSLDGTTAGVAVVPCNTDCIPADVASDE